MMFTHKKFLFVLISCFLLKYLPAQEFKIKAVLDVVHISGFYDVPILPELSAFSKSDFSDLRITDNKMKQVPYIIRKSLSSITGDSFFDFPILKKAVDSLKTIIEISSPQVQGNDQITLVIANNAVERFATISGSHDRQQWFIIDEKIQLGQSLQDAVGNFVLSLHIPFSKYKYYKLEVNNAHTDPLNIIRAGTFTDKRYLEPPKFRTNPPVSFIQTDSSNGISYVSIQQKAAYHIDRLVLGVEGPKFYKRTANIYYLSGNRMKNYVNSFEIISGQLPIISTGTIKAKGLFIEIMNNDNPPLTVQEIKTEQVNSNLVAYLEKGKSYFLLAGNESVNAPKYDLIQFRDSIPYELNSISYRYILTTDTKAEIKKVKDLSYLFWIAILLIMIVLGFLTFKLLNDMKRSGI